MLLHWGISRPVTGPVIFLNCLMENRISCVSKQLSNLMSSLAVCNYTMNNATMLQNMHYNSLHLLQSTRPLEGVNLKQIERETSLTLKETVLGVPTMHNLRNSHGFCQFFLQKSWRSRGIHVVCTGGLGEYPRVSLITPTSYIV